MKCPKCSYLGFETGDRCKNCGYDFSLLVATPAEPDLSLDSPASSMPTSAWQDELDRALGDGRLPPDVAATVGGSVPLIRSGEPASFSTASPLSSTSVMDDGIPGDEVHIASALPLFAPEPNDDAPLIKLSPPRPPLSVRRSTPETPRLRTVARARRNEPEPELEFVRSEPPARELRHSKAADGASRATPVAAKDACGAVRRATAALIDHAILFSVDLAVIYFTLRISYLSMDDWRLLPAAPLLAFLGLVKVAYFAAFTAVGGQTIGKMAVRIRVIAEDRALVEPARALQRTLMGGVSLLTLGAAFVPALIGSDRRALHDRVARTRVVALPSS